MEQISIADQAVMDSEIFRTTRELVDLSLKNEGMDLDFTEFDEDCEDCK